MLGLQYIRENKEAVLEGLKKRGFKGKYIVPLPKPKIVT